MRRYSIKKRLNIPEYKITDILSETEKEIHIKIEPYKRKRFICSGCEGVHKIGRHGIEEAIVKDLPIFEKRVYLHIVKRRYKCPLDKSTHIEEITWLKKWSRVTKRFAEQVNRLTAITTNQEAGWFLGLDDETVYRI
ncbi:transposase family protein, partial [bacterium]|nr:transposase family protein [bacterium]